jgi:hypothetical protein
MSAALAPLLREAALVFAPLRQICDEPRALVRLLARFGWVGDARALGSGPQVLAPVSAVIDALLTFVREFPTGGDPADLLPVCDELIELVRATIAAIDALADVDAKALARPWNQQALWIDLAQRIPETLLLDHIAARHPVLHMVLWLSGAVQEELRPADSDTGRIAVRVMRLHLDALGDWLAGPDVALQRRFGWGTSAPDIDAMLRTMYLAFAPLLPRTHRRTVPARLIGASGWWSPDNPALARAHGLDVLLLDGRLLGENALVRLGLSVLPIPSRPAHKPDGLLFAAIAEGAIKQEFPISPAWRLTVSAESQIQASVVVFPGQVKLGPSAPGAKVGLAVSGRPPTPWRLLGDSSGGAFLDLAGLEVGLAIEASAARPEVVVHARTLAADGNEGIRLGLAPTEGDSFINELLKATTIEAQLSIAARWSSVTGFSAEGEGKLRVDIPLERTLGPLKLHRVALELGVEGTPALPRFSGSFSLGVEVGPFVATVQDIGMSLALVPATAKRARFKVGSRGLGFGFEPPTGVGFAIDAETVKGGGFLSLDVDAGRYAGVLELVTPSFGLTALGILNTKIPGEPRGWSLFFALTATFNPGIQLGFGFVLTGVGGVFAVNRRLDEPAMRVAVRGGNLDSVLFPSDVVAEAPRIFATVESMFPIAKGSFVFGPMIKIGWGSPTLVEAMIGVFVSLPSPLIIALLGRVRLALPADEPILVLNMDIAGSINFGAGTVGLDAQIHDSSLWKLELTGGMAFRACFKDRPGFLLSVGGFHPAFDPPADVGPLARMGMSLRLGKAENVLVTLRSYFALTSNTLQFGAGIEVSAGVAKFKITGGAYFDALFVWRPFHFTADMGAYFAVTWRDWELLAVRVALTLDGPGPWRARGEATFTILKLELGFSFDETFGDEIAAADEKAPVRAPLRAALADPGNWSAEPGRFESLRLRDLPPGQADAEKIVVAPGDRLAFRQRVAPLQVKLEQMGPLEPQERGPFAVRVLTVGGRAPDPAAVVDVRELFAPAAFQDLGEDEKLAAPSFEPMRAGVALGGGWQAPAQRTTIVDGGFESHGGLWPAEAAAKSDPKVERMSGVGRRDPDAWRRREDLRVVVDVPRFVRAAADSLAPADEGVAWHEARARRVAGERILPAHAARKVGRG